MRRLLVALTFLIGWFALVPAVASVADVVPQRKWLRIDTPHFRVIGDAGPGALRQVAERMEQLHTLLGVLTTADERPPDTTVLVFRDAASYRPFQPAYNGVLVDVAGYFQPGAMNYITLLASQERDTHSVVFHEYVHLMLDRQGARVAPWLDEGLAEFYSTFDLADGGRTAVIGTLIQSHLWTMQRAMLPLEQLARVTHDSPLYNERHPATVFYAESWSLVHYLQLGRNRLYAAKFAPFAAALARGVPFAEACQQVLGVTAAELEAELKRYVERRLLLRANIPLPEAFTQQARVEPAPMGEADVHAVLGDLLRRLDGRPDAVAHLEHALAVDGTQPLALAAMARLHADAGRHDEARAFALRPTGPPTFQSEFYRAEALAVAPTGAVPQGPAIEAALRQAIRLNPSFAPALVALSRRLDDDATTLPEALQLVKTAIRLAPAHDEYRLQLARVQLLGGDITAARGVLGPLAARGATPSVKQAAREYLAYSAQREAAKDAERLALLDVVPAPGPKDAPSPDAPGTPPVTEPPPAPAGGTDADAAIPVLRPVGEGERRLFGTWAAIECVRGSDITLVAAVQGGELRVRAASLDGVDFISHRAEPPGAVGCGPQTPVPVYVTYRPGRSGTTAGVAVAVELMPTGYRPPQ